MKRSGKVITIATFKNYLEAHVIKAKLEAAGIWSYVADGNMVGYVPFFSEAVKLNILETDREKAIQIMNA